MTTDLPDEASDPCADSWGPAWLWCRATQSGAESRDAVLETVETVAGGAQGVVSAAISGAQDVTGKLAKGIGKAGTIKLDAGSVVAIAAIGIAGIGLADVYFTGGAGAASLRRSLSGGRR